MESAGIVNTFGLCATLLMGFLTLVLPWRFIVLPLLIVSCYITVGQSIVIANMNFTMLRIILLFSFFRVVIYRENKILNFNNIDKAVFLYLIINFVFHNILWQKLSALINSLGYSYDFIFTYLFFKYTIKKFDNIEYFIKSLSIIIIPLAIFMIVERTTGRNIFSVFGGVAEFSDIREGGVRCQGSFMHPIMAGTFGATLLPFFVGLWFKRGSAKLIATVGIISASIITITAHSSGALMTYFIGVLGMLMWSLRKHMKAFRRILLGIIIILQLFMSAPVWYIYSRLGALMGGTGWHRSFLIDQAIAHFNEWWLFGTKDTSSWTPYVLADGQADITNQFLAVGIYGGFLSMLLFILIIIIGFKIIGTVLKKIDMQPLYIKTILWSMGVTLSAHIAAFTSVPYFDQMKVFWYLLLAFLASISMFLKSDNLNYFKKTESINKTIESKNGYICNNCELECKKISS